MGFVTGRGEEVFWRRKRSQHQFRGWWALEREVRHVSIWAVVIRCEEKHRRENWERQGRWGEGRTGRRKVGRGSVRLRGRYGLEVVSGGLDSFPHAPALRRGCRRALSRLLTRVLFPGSFQVEV